MQQSAEKVVVFGGAGFIGSHLVDRLLADGRAEIVVFDNLSRGRLANLADHRAKRRLQVIEGDIRDAEAVAAALRGAGTAFHLAAQADIPDAMDDVEYAFTTNVVGTFNVLRAAAHQATARMIFASSHEVYGEPIGLPVDEAHPLLPVSTSGASKLVGEVYCRAFRRMFGLRSTVLRLGAIYGPRDSGPLIPIWLEQARAGRDLHVYGSKRVTDFIWVGHAVEALVRAARLDGPLPPINVGSGTGTRIVDVARRIARLAGSQGQLRLLPACAAEIMRFVANVDRMRQLLGIEPPLDPLAHLPTLLARPVSAAS